MRESYHEQLHSISDRLVVMTSMVGTAVGTATRALLEADVSFADRVIAGDAEVDTLRTDLDESLLELMARQAPVAGDLRTVVASLRISAEVERMGDLAVHIAKVARMRYPEVAVVPELRSTISSMGETAERMAGKAGAVIANRDLAAAAELETDDDEMDRLHRSLFLVLLDHDWVHKVEPAVDVALLGRYYERYADHAVSTARRIVYLVTGRYPQDATPA